MSANILLIDDDQELGDLLTEYLAAEGLTIIHKDNGAAGLEELQANEYQLVLLDVMMPGLNGFDVLKQLRQFSKIPVIMLTAKGDEFDRVFGLEIGADDYLPKPYSMRELLARIKAQLRRQQMDQQPEKQSTDIYSIEGLTINLANMSVQYQQTDVSITSTEFKLLHLLMQKQGHVVTKDQLNRFALGRPLAAYDRSIDMHVSNLRKKLQQASHLNFIKTVRGVGYSLEVQGE